MMWIWTTRVWRRTLIYRFSNVRIKENEEIKAGEVSLLGPSNAIESYVPQRGLVSKPSPSKNSKTGS